MGFLVAILPSVGVLALFWVGGGSGSEVIETRGGRLRQFRCVSRWLRSGHWLLP